MNRLILILSILLCANLFAQQTRIKTVQEQTQSLIYAELIDKDLFEDLDSVLNKINYGTDEFIAIGVTNITDTFNLISNISKIENVFIYIDQRGLFYNQYYTKYGKRKYLLPSRLKNILYTPTKKKNEIKQSCLLHPKNRMLFSRINGQLSICIDSLLIEKAFELYE